MSAATCTITPIRFESRDMIQAAPLLEGEHDFSGFAATDDREGSKVRTIWSSRMRLEGEYAFYRVRGSGFLKHMVRNIMGCLMEVRERKSWAGRYHRAAAAGLWDCGRAFRSATGVVFDAGGVRALARMASRLCRGSCRFGLIRRVSWYS